MAADSLDSEPWRLPDRVLDELLSVPRCRHVLAVLASHGSVNVHDLARHVAARERHADPDGVSAGAAMAVYDDLYDRHLPRLTETGVVEFDPQLATLALVDDAVIDRLE